MITVLKIFILHLHLLPLYHSIFPNLDMCLSFVSNTVVNINDFFSKMIINSLISLYFRLASTQMFITHMLFCYQIRPIDNVFLCWNIWIYLQIKTLFWSVNEHKSKTKISLNNNAIVTSNTFKLIEILIIN